VPFEDPPGRLIEENFWRAIRYGLDGRLIDLARAEQYPAASLGERLLAWTVPARAALGGVEPLLPEENGAQRQRRAFEAGASIDEVFAAEVAETQRTYAAQEVRA
jgi:glutamate---cysteine ligase / carboxylate-amine ligase